MSPGVEQVTKTFKLGSLLSWETCAVAFSVCICVCMCTVTIKIIKEVKNATELH